MGRQDDNKAVFWDGYEKISKYELDKEYPIIATPDLRLNKDKTRLAIINNFKKGTELYELADPEFKWPSHEKLLFSKHVATGSEHAEAEEASYGKSVFFHTFIGADALDARWAIRDFLANTKDMKIPEDAPRRVILINNDSRYGAAGSYRYLYGHIYTGMMEHHQEHLRSLITKTPVGRKNVFVLPLAIHMYNCPACGHRTLKYRGLFEICVECGWEDEPFTLGVNGVDTPEEYRDMYLSKKAIEPAYSWWR